MPSHPGRSPRTTTTFVLLHGSGDSGWVWHLVQRALRGRGHEALAPDLPTDREVPWPAPALPGIAARCVVTTRDRFLPPLVQRRVAVERLGITEPEEIEAGHCAALSRPEELAGILAGHVDRTGPG